MEKEIVSTSTDAIQALQATFGLYFVLNLEYPSAMSHTSEFIQRYFLKIHPDMGSK